MKKLSKLKLNSTLTENLTYREMKVILGGKTYIFPVSCGCACSSAATDDNCHANSIGAPYGGLNSPGQIVKTCYAYVYIYNP